VSAPDKGAARAQHLHTSPVGLPCASIAHIRKCNIQKLASVTQLHNHTTCRVSVVCTPVPVSGGVRRVGRGRDLQRPCRAALKASTRFGWVGRILPQSVAQYVQGAAHRRRHGQLGGGLLLRGLCSFACKIYKIGLTILCQPAACCLARVCKYACHARTPSMRSCTMGW
jgi:hypothetical protein